MTLAKVVPKLPSRANWVKTFGSNAHISRVSLYGAALGVKGLAALNLQNVDRMTAVELYPGAGVWTATLANAGFEKVIALEPSAKFRSGIEKLATQSQGRIIPLALDGYKWETYTTLRDSEYMKELVNMDWSEVHPRILYTGTIPKTSKGELLLAQLYSCITNRMAMHQFGRIQMALWVPTTLFMKLNAKPGDSQRCKMSVTSEICADTQLVLNGSDVDFQPKYGYSLIQVTPLAKPELHASWDVFEYVLRHLFVTKRQKLHKAIKTLGPGAEILLGRLTFDPDIDTGDMTTSQIDEVAQRFEEWPLRPTVLFEDTALFEDRGRREFW